MHSLPHTIGCPTPSKTITINQNIILPPNRARPLSHPQRKQEATTVDRSSFPVLSSTLASALSSITGLTLLTLSLPPRGKSGGCRGEAGKHSIHFDLSLHATLCVASVPSSERCADNTPAWFWVRYDVCLASSTATASTSHIKRWRFMRADGNIRQRSAARCSRG